VSESYQIFIFVGLPFQNNAGFTLLLFLKLFWTAGRFHFVRLKFQSFYEIFQVTNIGLSASRLNLKFLFCLFPLRNVSLTKYDDFVLGVATYWSDFALEASVWSQRIESGVRLSVSLENSEGGHRRVKIYRVPSWVISLELKKNISLCFICRRTLLWTHHSHLYSSHWINCWMTFYWYCFSNDKIVWGI
jgi:hypothetical protein